MTNITSLNFKKRNIYWNTKKGEVEQQQVNNI